MGGRTAMSLETAEDARRVARLMRVEYDRLLGYLAALEPEGWEEQSACVEWPVRQVVSHIGSQPLIFGAMLEASLRGAELMTDEQCRAIWDRFDGLGAEELLRELRRSNEALFRLIASLTDEQLGATMSSFAGPAPVATYLAARLNELVIHAWDIVWARDKAATLTPDAVQDLVGLNLTPTRLAGLVKPDRSERLVDKMVEFHLRNPERFTTLRLAQDNVEAVSDEAAEPDLRAELPAEAFVRLLWGRYDVAAGVLSGELILDQPELAQPLQALFPGR